MATKRDNNHAAITLRPASTDTTTPYNCTHEQPHVAEHQGTNAAATAAHTRYLSSPAAATLHGKT